MGRKRVRVRDDLIRERAETSLRDEAGFEVPHGTRSGIPRIRVQLLAGLLPIAVDPFERGA
jgi:hypothetical protein